MKAKSVCTEGKARTAVVAVWAAALIMATPTLIAQVKEEKNGTE